MYFFLIVREVSIYVVSRSKVITRYKSIVACGCVVLEESFFKNNEYDGLAIFRNDSGIVVSQGMFSKGLKTGIWEVLENGKLVKKSSADLSIKSKSPQQK